MKYTNFKLKLRTFLAVIMVFVVSVQLSAQQISVSGVVRDAATGEPIFGVNILEKGTTNGTITNFDGQFMLSVPSNATLVISYIGYLTKEVPVSGQRTLNVTLSEDAIALGEVVAIGYATVRKSDATGSLTAIKPDEMNKGLTTNAQDLLTGKIAGVNVTSDGGAPGAGAKIRIRGGSSLSASNDPLIIIDGLAMDNEGIKGVSNPLSMVNPNDIETFTVLKDASATAIYGSRASNGVIIITTKKGKANQKPKVAYDGNFSVSTIGKTIDVLTGDEFRDYVSKLYTDQPDVVSKLGTANTDWQSEIYQNAIGQDHNVNVTGGYKTLPYRVSFGYTNRDGIIKTSEFERYTGAINLSPSFFDNHLRVNLNAKGMLISNRFADQGVVGSAAAMDPTQPVKSALEPYKTSFGGYWQWYTTPNDVVTFNSLAPHNPVATLYLKNETANANNFIGSAEFDYKFHFLPELRARLNLAMDDSYGKQDLYQEKTASNDHTHGRIGWDKISKTNKSLSYVMQYSKEMSIQNVDVLAGYEWQEFYREGSYEFEGLDGYNPTQNSWKTMSRLVSFFGRLNYTLLDRYLFTATIRNDGTSRFSSENRWGLFPSVAFAWKINEENFLSGNPELSDLKLRLGYGITGQQDISQGDFPYIPVYASNIVGAYYPIGDEYITTYRPNAYNSKLKWEETTTWNAGLDFGYFKGRVTASVDYYYRITNDLINVVDVPAGSNFKNRVISNIGSLENQGLEFSTNVRAISQKDFTWEIGYNTTFNANKITKLTTGSGEGYVVETGGISAGTGNNVQAHAVGFPASSFYVYQQVYDSNNKPIEGLFVDRNADGIINDDDRYFHYNPAPDVTMGLSSKIIYKQFDFGVSIRASFGNYVYNDVDSRNANVGQSGIWSTSGFFSNRPESTFENNFTGKTNWYFSDHYVQNASFARVDNITVGYSFTNLFKVIKNGRIYTTVQNPLIITKYTGLDPEIFGGIDNDIYPRPVITMVGLSLNF